MHDLNDLYTRYLYKQCSPEEIRMLLAHFHLAGEESTLRSRILRELGKSNTTTVESPEVEAALERIHDRLLSDISPTQPDRSKTKWRYRISLAAAALLFTLIGSWFLAVRTADRPTTMVHAVDIAPGGNKATLALENGKAIALNESQRGIIVGDEITYNDGSHVFSEASAKETAVQFYKLTTPKGGTYQIALPDGTKVWLNAASELKYPNHFTEKERIVELKGEAYFDVQTLKNDVPFKVISEGQIVEVLGTQFNISAYPDEYEIQTTLVEGSVQIAAGDRHEIMQLKPGEQGTLTDTRFKKAAVDISTFIAWKDDLFSFSETELRVVMNQLSRWYDVTVEYQGDIPTTFYYGAISRGESLANVLDLLRQSGLKFKIDKTGDTNKLIVLP